MELNWSSSPLRRSMGVSPLQDFKTVISVRRWNPLYVVDYYDLGRRPARFQFQPELLLNRLKQAGLIARQREWLRSLPCARRSACLIRRPLKINVVDCLEACGVQHTPVESPREKIGQSGHGEMPTKKLG